MGRYLLLVGILGLVSLVGCNRQSADSNETSTRESHTDGGPEGDLSGSPTGLYGDLEVVTASDFAMPTTPEELLAPVLRAIELEDFESINKLHYGSDNIRSVDELKKSFKDLVVGSNRMGLDKDHWGIKRLVLSPLKKPIRAEFLRGDGGNGGVPFTKIPLPTHEIRFEYDWQVRPHHGSRMSSYLIGEKDGHWFIATNQRAAPQKK